MFIAKKKHFYKKNKPYNTILQTIMTTNQIQFSNEELARYSRHIIIPEFNIEGQRRLKAARVLVIGSGGLGSPVLLYLAAAGIGNIGIVDFDVVDDSNLQRQVLFTQQDIGKPKAETAKQRLLALNPHINITVHNERLTSDNALQIFENYDIIADGTDNFPTRYLVNDACVLLNKINVYASIFRFEGQVAVFNYPLPSGQRSPNYRDLFPEPPPAELVPNCSEGGVIGVLPGIIGSMQANEVIKIASGVGTPLAEKLFLFDAATFETRILKIRKNKNNPLTGDNPTQTTLIDYVQFCNVQLPTPPQNNNNNTMENNNIVKEITVQELKQLLDKKADIQIIDVRETYEYEIVNIGATLIPLATVADNQHLIDPQKQVIVHCRSGVRSAKAILQLQALADFQNLYNLKGGILAYADQIDPSLPKY